MLQRSHHQGKVKNVQFGVNSNKTTNGYKDKVFHLIKWWLGNGITKHQIVFALGSVFGRSYTQLFFGIF